MQFCAYGVGQNEILATDRLAFRSKILGGGKQRWQHDGTGVHARGIVLVVKIQRVSRCAVSHGGRGRRIAAPADKPRG